MMSAPRTLCQNAYLPYPHTNAFLDEQHVLLVQNTAQGSQIIAVNLKENSPDSTRVVAELDTAATAVHVVFDIARGASRMALIYNRALYLLDPRQCYSALPDPVYKPATGVNLYSIPSIRSDGTRALVLEDSESLSAVKEIELATGRATTLLTKNWLIGHVHYVPGDENWVAFCHEGATEKIPDRMWAWHAAHAPQGRCVFDQKSDDPKEFLNVGHERWGFTDASGLAVAYGCSPVGPRGLWKVFADGRPAKRIFANDRCWHCDISRDGLYALADTSGTWNLPGHGWEGHDGNHSILLIDVATGKHVVLGTAGGDRHPYHPHPVFAPDGRSVLFNTKRGDDRAVMIVKIDEALESLRAKI